MYHQHTENLLLGQRRRAGSARAIGEIEIDALRVRRIRLCPRRATALMPSDLELLHASLRKNRGAQGIRAIPQPRGSPRQEHPSENPRRESFFARTEETVKRLCARAGDR